MEFKIVEQREELFRWVLLRRQNCNGFTAEVPLIPAITLQYTCLLKALSHLRTETDETPALQFAAERS